MQPAADPFHNLTNSQHFPASVSEPAQIQISNGDSRKTAHYEMIALEDISQEQSEEQVSLLMQPTISFISGLVATEQEIPGRHDFWR